MPDFRENDTTVAVYCRVSTRDQHPEIQEKDLLGYCERMGYKVYKVYTDKTSGKKQSRPALNDMLFDMRAGHFTAIVCTKLDRLGRSLQHLINIAQECHNKDVGLIFAHQSIDTTTPQGKLFYHILGAVAEFEAELISERTREGLKDAENVGKRGKDKKPRKKGGYYLRYQKKGVWENEFSSWGEWYGFSKTKRRWFVCCSLNWTMGGNDAE